MIDPITGVERLDFGDGPVVFTCEHATDRLPAGMTWGADARLAGTHWAWDPGAADLTRALASRFRARAVLAGFSRLLVDPNRPLDSDTLFRATADGQPIAMNARLTDADRAARIAAYYQPFHAAADEVVGGSSAGLVLSVHSFTPVYEGYVRKVQIGVLYDTEDALAAVFADAMAGGPFDVQHNEPWSGKGGLMFSPAVHASAHGRRALEVELRQDLLADPASFASVVDVVEAGLRAVLAAMGT